MTSTVYRLAVGVVVAFLFSAVAIYNVTNAAPSTSSSAASSTRGRGPGGGIAEFSKRRLREGTIVHDQTGYFRQDGDGATFVADSGMELGGLPNLNLERIARTLKTTDEPKSIRWSVSGTITEFSGRNFLLISRAVFKTTSPPPVPEQLAN